MDKYEYKVRAEEIKELIARRDYAQAAEIADSIDWRRIKSVMMLCTISDLYKINRRYEDARDLLLLAYERRPGGKNICYSLCELSIKTGEFVQAMEYYKEFVQAAPNDPGRYILQYKLYVDQDVSLEERIAVLEELKKHDYREKWAYELAYLYHRVGLATQCVQECDEIILWFGEGEYVTKAMELKMLHQPLTPEQQEQYDRRFEERGAEGESDGADGQDAPSGIAEGDTQVYEPVRIEEDGDFVEESASEDAPNGEEPAGAPDKTGEMDIQVKTMDVGQYNTLNLQAELAQELKELLNSEQDGADNAAVQTAVADAETPAEDGIDSDTESLDSLEIEEISEDDLEPETAKIEESEVFFGETGEIVLEQMRREEEAGEPIPGIAQTVYPDKLAEKRMAGVQPPKELAHVLSQESDGQISLVIPDSSNVEKQITGQMNIQDVLVEWERMKKENEKKRQEEVRQHVLRHTGNMFTEFEASVRDGLLEQLEKGGDEPDDTLTENDVVEELEEIDEAGEAEISRVTDIQSPDMAAEAAEEAAPEEEAVMEEEAAPADEAAPEEEATLEDESALMDEAIPEDEASSQEESALAEELAPEEESVPEEELASEEESVPVEELTPEDDLASEEELASEDELAPEDEPVPEDEASSQDESASAEESAPEEHQPKVRSMSPEERELYANYIQDRSTKEQIVKAVDDISLAAYTGNVIVTGEPGVDTISLAKNMIREIQAADSNFSGKVAKISGKGLNRKNIEDTLNQLQNGALIVESACDMDADTVENLYKALQKESLGIIVILQDDTRVMNRFLKGNGKLLDVFTARVDVKAPSNDVLVAYGKQYAKEQEYSIDELGVLALHNRIEERQTMDHAVTTMEVKDIVNLAIRHANRKSVGHFFDVLFSKRYDEEDMIIVSEKDFV